MSGHEMCAEGVYNSEFKPGKYLGTSLLEDPKDKVIDDLVTTLKAYAGVWDDGDKDGFFWSESETFCYMDKFGSAYSAGGPEIALKKLREYNLIDQG